MAGFSRGLREFEPALVDLAAGPGIARLPDGLAWSPSLTAFQLPAQFRTVTLVESDSVAYNTLADRVQRFARRRERILLLRSTPRAALHDILAYQPRRAAILAIVHGGSETWDVAVELAESHPHVNLALVIGRSRSSRFQSGRLVVDAESFASSLDRLGSIGFRYLTDAYGIPPEDPPAGGVLVATRSRAIHDALTAVGGYQQLNLI